MKPIPSIQQAVWQAADELMAQGQRPTVASVREITRRGSAGTINDALKTWWENLSGRLRSNLPRSDLPEPVAALALKLWETSLEYGEAAFEQLRADSLAQAEQAQKERQATLEALEQRRQQFQALEQRHEALQAVERELITRLSGESSLRQELEQRLAEQARLLGEAETARSQVEKELALLAAQYRHTEEELQHRLTGVQDQLAREQEHHETVSALQARQLKESEDRLAQAEMLLAAGQGEIRLLQQRMVALQEENLRLKLDAHKPANRRDTLKARLRRE